MWAPILLLSSFVSVATSSILQNGQLRENPYPGQANIVDVNAGPAWKTYPPDAKEISYKGRWDSKHISWWSAPGIKLGFTGERLALSFGEHTDEGVLVAYRIGGQDWQFSNVTADSTYQFISPDTPGLNLTDAGSTRTFEMRAGVATDDAGGLVEVKPFDKTVEIIGDSLSAGQYATYEGISSWSWGFVEGLANVEYSITAYPGICLHDKECWGNLRGQTYQWYQTSDTSYRATQIWGEEPEKWDFSSHPAADLVLINIGTNDFNEHNNVTSSQFYNSYIEMIDGIHEVWPSAHIVIISLTFGFHESGDTYLPSPAWVDEIQSVYQNYLEDGQESFVHLFNMTGVLQHNDIGPQWHPTDVGHIKTASHLLQYVRMKFGYDLEAVGPEIQHDTLYWNNQANY